MNAWHEHTAERERDEFTRTHPDCVIKNSIVILPLLSLQKIKISLSRRADFPMVDTTYIDLKNVLVGRNI
jgi:hypothetical protein